MSLFFIVEVSRVEFFCHDSFRRTKTIYIPFSFLIPVPIWIHAQFLWALFTATLSLKQKQIYADSILYKLTRPPIVAKCDRKRVLSAWAPYCGNMAPAEFQIEFSSVRHLSPREFVEKLSKDIGVRGVVAGKFIYKLFQFPLISFQSIRLDRH